MISRRDFLAGLAATAVLPPLLAARASESLASDVVEWEGFGTDDWAETFYGIDWGKGDRTVVRVVSPDEPPQILEDGEWRTLTVDRVTAQEVRESEEMVRDRWRAVFSDLEADRDRWLKQWTEIAARIQV